MLEWRRVQAVVEKVCGIERVVVRAGDLDEPWRWIYARLKAPAHAAMVERAVWEATEGREDRNRLYETVMAVVPGPEVLRQFKSLKELAEELRPVEWLGQGWMPKGGVAAGGGARRGEVASGARPVAAG